MPNTVAVDDILEVTFLCSRRSQQSNNVRHYQVTSTAGGSQSDVQIAAALSAAFESKYKDCMAQAANFDGVKLQIFSPVKRPAVAWGGDGGAGNVVGDPLPTQTCGIIALKTNEVGRKRRGRVFMPFPSEGSNTADNKPAAGHLSALGVIASQFISPLTVIDGGASATIFPVLFSRTDNAAFLLIDAVARVEWGTNRRRSHINRTDVIITPG